MYDTVTELMLTLAEGARTNEAFAHDLAAMARKVDAAGPNPFAKTLFAQARLHRVKAMEERARLAALADAHGALHLER